MNFSEIKKFYPQKMFLVQGEEVMFDSLLKEIKNIEPLVHSLSVPRFTVDHARNISQFISEGNGKERFFVVFFSFFSIEAANILLKNIEEPDLYTTIIFITPYPYTIPQTIRSRVFLLQNTREILDLENLSYTDSVNFVKNELSSESEEDAATRKAKAIIFLDSLEKKFRKNSEKISVIYEAKHMLFKANIPSKYVIDYTISCIF